MIVKWLGEGKGVRKVAKMLQEMYPDDKSKWLSTPTLQEFRTKHMKLEAEAIAKVKKVTKLVEEAKTEAKAEIKAEKDEHRIIKNLPSYKQKLSEIVDAHVDIKVGLVNMEKLITSRMEDLFDAAQRGAITTEREKVLQGYFDRYFSMIDRWAKYIDRVADVKVETNINVTVVQDQMAMLRQTVYELLQEMDPELAVTFLDRLNNRVRELTYKKSTPPTLKDLNVLKDQITQISEVIPEAVQVCPLKGENDAD